MRRLDIGRLPRQAPQLVRLVAGPARNLVRQLHRQPAHAEEHQTHVPIGVRPVERQPQSQPCAKQGDRTLRVGRVDHHMVQPRNRVRRRRLVDQRVRRAPRQREHAHAVRGLLIQPEARPRPRLAGIGVDAFAGHDLVRLQGAPVEGRAIIRQIVGGKDQRFQPGAVLLDHRVQPSRKRPAALRRHDLERGVVELEDNGRGPARIGRAPVRLPAEQRRIGMLRLVDRRAHNQNVVETGDHGGPPL